MMPTPSRRLIPPTRRRPSSASRSHSPAPASHRALPQHLQQHLPERLGQRPDVLAVPPPRAIPEERLVQQPRLEDVLQRRVEEAGVAEVEQAAGGQVALRFPREGRRPRPGGGLATPGESAAPPGRRSGGLLRRF